MELFNKIGKRVRAVADVAMKYVVKPTAAVLAGPLVSWGIWDGIKIAAGKVGVDGLALDTLKGLTSSAVTLAALASVTEQPIIQPKEQATVVDEESALIATDVKINPQHLNAKGKTFVWFTATAIGTAATLGTAEILRAANFPDNLENTNPAQQELIAHYIPLTAGSIVTAATQYGLQWLANRNPYFHQSLIKNGHIKETKDAYLVLEKAEDEPKPINYGATTADTQQEEEQIKLTF